VITQHKTHSILTNIFFSLPRFSSSLAFPCHAIPRLAFFFFFFSFFCFVLHYGAQCLPLRFAIAHASCPAI
jgi:hypothetical protein